MRSIQVTGQSREARSGQALPSAHQSRRGTREVLPPSPTGEGEEDTTPREKVTRQMGVKSHILTWEAVGK